MDDELTEKLKSLEEQVGVIKDESLRRIAFEKLLEGIVPFGKRQAAEEPELRDADSIEQKTETVNLDGFFSKLKQGKPSDNALAVAGFHYSLYGSEEFTADEIRDIADQVGITVPERVDMTYKNAQREGKSLFRRSGNGFRPTVHGELFFKKTYQVNKGTKNKPVDNDKQAE